MLNFRNIDVSDFEKIEEAVAKSGYMTCQLSAASLFCYDKAYHTEICFHEGFLFVKQDRYMDGTIVYFFPIGSGNLQGALGHLLDYHGSHNDFKLWGLDDSMRNNLDNIAPCLFEYISERNWAEYIYEAQNFIQLSGPKYKWKREWYNKFMNNYGDIYQYERINECNIQEVVEFHELWLKENDVTLQSERDALTKAVLHYTRLKLAGALIRIEGSVCAYTIGAPVNDDMFDILFEKAQRSFAGLYPAMAIEFAKRELCKYQFVSREEDLGLEGLRKSKLCYRPDILMGKYIGTPKGSVDFVYFVK